MSFTIQEQFSVRYAGQNSNNHVGRFGCCSQFDGCAKARRCVSVFCDNTENNKCGRFYGLQRCVQFTETGVIGGFKEMSEIKEFYSTLDNGIKVRYLAGKNVEDKQAFAVYFQFNGQWLLLTSVIPKSKVNKAKLDAWVLHQFEKEAKRK